MDASGGIATGLAGRYATALFGLARDENAIEAVSTSLAGLKAALAESGDLAKLTTSAVVSRTQAKSAIAAVAGALGTDPLTARFLGVLAENRRLAALPAVIRTFDALAADARGEMRAAVTSAVPLDAAQKKALATRLKTELGREVAIDLDVDPAILGGLVVRIGSRMIDSSIATKLNSLAYAMKG